MLESHAVLQPACVVLSLLELREHPLDFDLTKQNNFMQFAVRHGEHEIEPPVPEVLALQRTACCCMMGR